MWRKLIPPGLSEVECSFIEQEAALQRGEAVLDLMCGYGRHALELARRGYDVTAIDNQKDYIAEINAVRQQENLPSIKTSSESVLNVHLDGFFKAVICMGNSFAFFNRTDAIYLLKKIADHLQADGIFIINTWMIAEIAIRHFQEREWHYVDNYKYLLEYKFCFSPSRIESEHTLILPDDTIEVVKGVDYIFTLDELQAMFTEAGLSLRAVYSTPKRRAFKMGDNRAYLVVEKKAV